MINYPYLNDSAFLKQFDRIRNQEQYVKITVLDLLENPIESIEGRVTGGNLNLAGNSAIRRTSNLSLVATELENNLTEIKHLLSINKKVSIEIGFLNSTNEYLEYPILWFPQGVFVIISPSLSHGADGVNISLQLKDKMCLLNGECGGTITASTTFHEYDTIDEETGEWIIAQSTIYQIIQELVNHFGGEQLGKIIISDIDNRIKKVMKWTGNVPLYMWEDIDEEGNDVAVFSLDYNEREGEPRTFENGDDIGYVNTNFTYPGELIANAGDSVVTILDKIKNTLGNYEYFYDINGNFVFQEVKNYLNTSQSTVALNDINNGYLVDLSGGKSVYTFDDATLITSYSNSPKYNMIKNDFLVWGIRESASGVDLPIRYHLAIDKKPVPGTTYEVYFYEDAEDDGLWKASAVENKYTTEKTEWTTLDWREELYFAGVMSEEFATDSGYYYTELKAEWPKLVDYSPDGRESIKERQNVFRESVLERPYDIDYFLDFIDSGAEIGELSISNIGRRSKVVNDNKVNCMFEPTIPDIVFIQMNQDTTKTEREECIANQQTYYQFEDNLYNNLAVGGSLNSAFYNIQDLLYQYTGYNNSISLQAIPIYHLEPNTRITVKDVESGIYGDYMIDTISIPLTPTGTMTLSCSLALERI